MTIAARAAQKRGMSIGQGGWGTAIGDPAAIPPPGAYSSGAAGVVVNERTVLSLMVVATCIRVIGDTAAGLAPKVYRQKGTEPDPQDKRVDAPPVIVSPYADISRRDGDFRCIASFGLNGNVFKHVVDRDAKGNPLQVEIINPSMLKVELVNGVKTYKVGSSGKVIPAADIVHVPWMSLAGGLVGLNPIEIGVNGFGIPIAANEYAGRYFAQGMHPTGILSVEKPLRPEDSDRVASELFTKSGGLAQAHTPIVLDSNAKWQQISVTPETAQLLQSREFSRGEIAGFYGVPGNLVGEVADQGGPWGKGLQELVMGFAIFHLSGYTERLDEADTALLPAGYYAKRDVKELFYTNFQMLGEYVSALRMSSIASPNEGRAIIGLPPSDEPGSDSIWGPLNSAHNDWLAQGDSGPESGLPGGLNPKGAPNGTAEGGAPPVEGGQ